MTDTDKEAPKAKAKAEPILDAAGEPVLAFPTWDEAQAQADIIGGTVEAVGTACVIRQ